MFTSRLSIPTPRSNQKVSKIKWHEIDFGPINLYNVLPAYKMKG